MRRRNELKKTADASSPAVTARRSGRRRKSTSMSESERNDEYADETGENKNRASSEEPEVANEKISRRARGRRRTPVNSSSPKRKNRRTESPEAKFEAIAEEESKDFANDKNNDTEKSKKTEEKPNQTIDGRQDDDNRSRETMETPRESEGKDERDDNVDEVKVIIKEKEQKVTTEKSNEDVKQKEVIGNSRSLSPEAIVDEHSTKTSIGDYLDIKEDSQGQEDNSKIDARDDHQEHRLKDKKKNEKIIHKNSDKNDEKTKRTIDEMADESRDSECNGKHHQIAKSPIREPGELDSNENSIQIDTNSMEPDKLSDLNSQIATKSIDTGTARTQRKRKWLSKKSVERKAPIMAITTDSLKGLISDVHPVPLSDVMLDSSSEIEEVPSEREEGEETPSPRPRKERQHNSIEKMLSEKPIIKRTISQDPVIAVPVTAANATIVKTPRPPSPARNKTSNVLFITNLVRPFTVMQLKSLLARTGKITEDGFWIDRIKSKCYVQYETEDEAIETRHALHGVRWPVSNPKCLNVDFGKKADMDRAIESTKEDAPKLGQDSKDNLIIGSGWSRGERHDEIDRKNIRPVREWDVGKKDNLDREREREREKNREVVKKRSRDSRERDLSANRENEKNGSDRKPRNRERRERTRSATPVRKTQKKENEPPLRLLDDLFRKTKATPCIYWLPLTPEQVKKRSRDSRERDLSANRENEKNGSDRKPRNRERRERTRSATPVRKTQKKENEPPLRLLDDLFRKTKATPCIYWLPLTPEQIAEKEAYRQKRIAEHKERVKQRELEREKEREKERENRNRGSDRDRERDRRSRRSRSRDRRRY